MKEEVKFHFHIFTNDGLKTHPEKVRAVVEMPRPTDKRVSMGLTV